MENSEKIHHKFPRRSVQGVSFDKNGWYSTSFISVRRAHHLAGIRHYYGRRTLCARRIWWLAPYIKQCLIALGVRVVINSCPVHLCRTQERPPNYSVEEVIRYRHLFHHILFPENFPEKFLEKNSRRSGLGLEFIHRVLRFWFQVYCSSSVKKLGKGVHYTASSPPPKKITS